MTIHIDHLLKKGKTHKICEDYIISGYNPAPYIILSDGCSSSKNTDVGARVLCHVAKQYLENSKDSIISINKDSMGTYIIFNALTIITQMGLDPSALDATLTIAYYHDETLNIIMFGDGIIVSVYNDNAMIETIEYTKNAPFYLSYKLDNNRRKCYHDHKVIKTINKQFLYNPFDIYNYSCKNTVEEIDYSQEYISTHYLDSKKEKTIFIFSDGISSFFKKDESKFLSIHHLLKDFSSFKTINGEFLHRRLLNKRGAITLLEQQGYDHFDDLSVGAFIVRG